MSYAKQVWLIEQKRPAFGERCFVIWNDETKIISQYIMFTSGYQIWTLWKGRKTYWLSSWNLPFHEALYEFHHVELQRPRHKGQIKWQGKLPDPEITEIDELILAAMDRDPVVLDMLRDVITKGG